MISLPLFARLDEKSGAAFCSACALLAGKPSQLMNTDVLYLNIRILCFKFPYSTTLSAAKQMRSLEAVAVLMPHWMPSVLGQRCTFVRPGSFA